jgi:hypothetical protein
MLGLTSWKSDKSEVEIFMKGGQPSAASQVEQVDG